MPNPIPIPAGADDVSAEWLTAALRAGGGIQCQIADVEKQPLGQGVGFLSSMLRCLPRYSEPRGDEPASLIVKLKPTADAYRATADEYNAFEREIRFYQEVAPNAPIPVPRLLYGAWDERDAVMVLEDLGRLTRPNQVHGISQETTEAAVRRVAILQARYWDNADLDALSWMPRDDKRLTGAFPRAWPGFEEAYGLRLGSDAIALGRKLRDRLDWLEAELARRPHTVVHGDFRADNMLLGEPGSVQEVVIIDWQVATRCLGALDPARLLSGSEPGPERSGHQLDTFRAWHRSLLDHGVTDYPEDVALEDFRLAVLATLRIPLRVFEIMGADPGGRAGQLIDAIATRTFAAAQELDVGSLLD